jgi:uncharacterized LabA/DUF88 family protein
VAGGAVRPNPVRTNVYVDGFNLYFGCLKGTRYKWLNVAELCRRSLPTHYQVNRIRYFTALVTPTPSNPQTHVRQQTLLRALATVPHLTIHYGTFLAKTKTRPLAKPIPGLPAYVDVLDREEKGSDVNLATYLLFDAFGNDYDAAVVVSDDSDLAEPIRIVRRHFKKHIRVLSPRGKSRVLSQAATRFQQIAVANLRAAQFPTKLADAHGVITKPAGW